MVAGVQAGLYPQDTRPCGELFGQCEIQAIATRIANAVVEFFQAIARFFQEVWQFISNGCSFRDRFLLAPPIGMGDNLPNPPIEEVPLIEEVEEIIEETWQVPVAERVAILPQVLPFIDEGMDRGQKREIIEAIAEIPAQDRDVVIPLARQLIPEGMDGWSVARILRMVTVIPAEERGAVIPLARLMITERMNGWDIERVLQDIVAIPAQDRETVITFGRQLITQAIGRWERPQLFQTVLAVPAQDREGVTALTRLLITERMGVESVQDLVESICLIPAPERGGVILRALPLITDRMARWDKQDVITAINAIPAEDRDDVMRHARDLVTPEMGGAPRAAIIRDIAALPEDQRREFVRRGGNPIVFNPLPPLVDFQMGMNVHDGDRDQRTHAAMALLCRQQGDISADRLNQAMAEFTAFLDASAAFNVQEKQLARDALLRQVGGGFGPLIEGQYDLEGGLHLTGTDLIGRLWLFASELDDANEVINAKNGMIAALKDSYDQWGGMVCNAGKAQRLVVSVLQGRLEGVNIEGDAFIQEQVTVEQAQEMFFHVEAHRNVDVINELVVVVNRFCNENPAVNRQDFFLWLCEYVHEQGFE